MELFQHLVGGTEEDNGSFVSRPITDLPAEIWPRGMSSTKLKCQPYTVTLIMSEWTYKVDRLVWF